MMGRADRMDRRVGRAARPFLTPERHWRTLRSHVCFEILPGIDKRAQRFQVPERRRESNAERIRDMNSRISSTQGSAAASAARSSAAEA